ncbi:MAG: fatty acid desaturase [Bacteroidetes bacterium]|nr:fatty acid desaturase [Bacteroidota bacterium]
MAYMVVTTALLVVQWSLPALNPFLYAFSLFMAVTVTVIAHNHNHLPIWRKKWLNVATDYWLTIFYGFPAFAWIPTHNKNHHALNNKAGDYTITYRYSEKNNLLTLVAYPTVSSFYQQKPIRNYLKQLWNTNRREFYLAAMQYAALGAFLILAFIIDWQKALLYIFIPQQVGLFAVLVFNYVQHVHAEEESEWNHSRNFTGFLNKLLFNNGYHTVHHQRAGIHWSLLPEHHARVEHLIDSSLKERSFWWYIIRVYFLGPFVPAFRTHSMRLERLKRTSMTPRPQ